jgi:hypothetical protein
MKTLKNRYTAQEFVEYHEYGLGLDTITTQMYEYNIEIDQAFYETIREIADKMKLPPESYSHMKELIKS